jgi:hypothetical protein
MSAFFTPWMDCEMSISNSSVHILSHGSILIQGGLDSTRLPFMFSVYFLFFFVGEPPIHCMRLKR